MRSTRTSLILLLAGAAALAFGQEAADPAAGRGQVRGTVTGGGGAPVPGVSIVLSPAGRPDILYASASDEAGKYAFNGIIADQYAVLAEGPGQPSLLKQGVSVRPPFRPVLDLEMRAPETESAQPPPAPVAPEPGRIGEIEGILRNVAGEGVVEGSITLRRVGDPLAVFYVRTSPDGRFRFVDLPAGIYDIATRAPGLVPLHLVARPLAAVPVLHLRLWAPVYPLSFRGWIDDLLPPEIPVPPPDPRPAELAPPPVPAAPSPSNPSPPAAPAAKPPAPAAPAPADGAAPGGR